MVEINRKAYGLLELESKRARRTVQDQAGVILEEMLEAKADVEALAPDGESEGDPVTAVAADPDGDMHKTALG